MAGVYRSRDVCWAASVLSCVLSLFATMGVALTVCASAFGSPPRYELLDQFGPDGTDKSSFAVAGPVAVDQQSHAVYVADGSVFSPGKLYKFAGDGSPLNWGGVEPYIVGNEISGLDFSIYGKVEVAVDSVTHAVYVTSANSIRAFQGDGEPLNFSAGPYAGSNELSGFGELTGLAVDVNGYIYASDGVDEAIKIFAPSGEPIVQFSAEHPANLAVSPDGSVYAVQYFGNVLKFIPSTFPVSGSTLYAAAPAPIDSQFSAAVGVDPVTGDVYVVHNLLNPGVAVYDDEGNLKTTFGAQDSEGELFQAGGVAVDGIKAKVFVGNRPASGPSRVDVYQPEPPAAPKIEVRTVADVSDTSATLYARINPNQRATTYRFEYGLGDCSTTLCTTVPLGGAPIGSGNDGVWVSQKLQGLNPDTEYHYRVVAVNELGDDESSSTFRTQRNDLTIALSDSRAWEMVSPPNKGRGLLRGTQESGGPVRAAVDGNGIAYVSISPIEAEPDGTRTPEASTVLARRDASGWRSEDITPPNAKVTQPLPGQQAEYKLFSPDLSKALLDNRSGTALSVEASERTPYLRENTIPPTYRPLVTSQDGYANVPSGIEFGGGEGGGLSDVLIQDATPDLSHVVLGSRVPLFDGAPDFGIYEWREGQLSPISVLPADEGGVFVSGVSGSSSVSMRHMISDEGSRVFWSDSQHLFMREMKAGKTVKVDEVQEDEGASGAGPVKAVFQGASADGSVVYFSDTQQLTVDASPSGADLYRCEITDLNTGCNGLLNLTAPQEGSGESGKLEGVVSGLTDDGSRVYFVARGVLTNKANAFGEEAEGGEPNLYLWEEGTGFDFLATLASGDYPDWGFPGEAAMLSTSTSPNGRYFTFMSERGLTDQGSVDVDARVAVEQIFRFDADTDHLICVSCPPGGVAPQGALVSVKNELVDPRNQWFGRHVAATLPQPVVLSTKGPTLFQPRVVLDNGRVFFNAIDSLVQADSNKQWDVYQYEDLGTGDCNVGTGNAAVKRSGDGCVSLLSSGTGDTEVGFLDASASGDDVFFLTPARLSVTDVDNELDLYDARVNGVTAVLNPEANCSSGEACHPAAPQLQDVAPGSASFNGPGNLKSSKKCPKGKRMVRRHGKKRCAPRKGKRHHRRAGQRKGAAR